jgi:hypothetical protein
MIPIGNEYIEKHEDPILAQLECILTIIAITQKERFGLIKGLTNGSQARKIMSTPATRLKKTQKKNVKARAKKANRGGMLEIFIEGLKD